HTHSRRLDLHPHVHLVMPGASLDARSRRWRTKSGYLFSHKALAKVFRAKLLAALAQAGLHPAEPLPGKWVVDCKRVGNGEKALVYLGRYLYRGVIREADLLACDHDGSGQVSFRYRDSQSGESKVRTLPGAEFLHLLLQHVLPKGFRRARNYGFLHPNRKSLIALLHIVLKIAPRTLPVERPRPAFLCPCCGAPMQIIRRRIPAGTVRRRTSATMAETAV
ncbi:MAG: transposase, partial [Candidatus Dechloromonas phosphoritropha]